ncbi:hypothetical protein M8J76_009763 [Diaphorina citri]|nr:hypothetical protein M8J76_009763 [Diaphorina citri]
MCVSIACVTKSCEKQYKTRQDQGIRTSNTLTNDRESDCSSEVMNGLVECASEVSAMPNGEEVGAQMSNQL